MEIKVMMGRGITMMEGGMEGGREGWVYVFMLTEFGDV
jgi:hypothetical protein